MQPLRVREHRRQIGPDLARQGQLARCRARAHDLQLLLQLAREVDRRDVQRHRARLDAGQVEQLLRHPQHALRLLVDDLSRAPLLGPGLQAAVDQRLAEADEARQRRLELMGDVGEEVALHPPRILNTLGHTVEGGSEQADLVGSADAHAPRVVARGDVLRGAGQLGERPGHRAAQEQHEDQCHQQRYAARDQEPRHELRRGGSCDRRLGAGDHDVGGVQRISRRGDGKRRREVGLAAEIGRRLGHTGHPPGGLDRQQARGLAGAVVDDEPVAVEQDQPVGTGETGDALSEAGGVHAGASDRPRVGDHTDGVQALLVANQLRFDDDRTVELVLRALQLDVPHQHPGESAAQQQAHGDDAGGGGQEA